jgi:hypothetical protein
MRPRTPKRRRARHGGDEPATAAPPAKAPAPPGAGFLNDAKARLLKETDTRAKAWAAAHGARVAERAKPLAPGAPAYEGPSASQIADDAFSPYAAVRSPKDVPGAIWQSFQNLTSLPARTNELYRADAQRRLSDASAAKRAAREADPAWAAREAARASAAAARSAAAHTSARAAAVAAKRAKKK